MSQKNNAADKVRPIIKAMERSIEAARSTRLQPVPKLAAPVPSHSPTLAASSPAAAGARLKARPKRSWM